jgi:hypothetical protein
MSDRLLSNQRAKPRVARRTRGARFGLPAEAIGHEIDRRLYSVRPTSPSSAQTPRQTACVARRCHRLFGQRITERAR